MVTTFPTVKNCPQLILGAPSNVNSQDAVAAFARASKRIKSGENTQFSIEDLTSALSAIEAALRSEESGLKFSVPADPIHFNKSLSFEFGGEVFKFDSDLSKVNVEQLDLPLKALAGQVHLAAAIHQLLIWNWSKASEYARICLRLSDKEDERDEALNVIAASLAAQGDDVRALDALKKAVEGQWNLALQANLALIASEIDPDLAIEHISYLVDGARTAGEKILGSPFKYADIPQLYGKPLKILCMGGAEKVCRESYGNLPGEKTSAQKQKILECFREIGIEYIGATDILKLLVVSSSISS